MIGDDTQKAAFSIAELAHDFGLSQSFIRKEIREGRLTPYRIGPKLIRISRLEWEAYLSKNVEAYLNKNGRAKGVLPDA